MKDARARFHACYSVQGNGCWLWRRSSASKRRYASFYVDGRSRQAHHAAWILFRGELPQGVHVLHKCDTPRCVNPDHLFLGTHADNMADMKTKGRARSASGDEHWTRRRPEKLKRGAESNWYGVSRVGSNNPRSRLTEDVVAIIKARIRSGESDISIAKDVGVRPGAIWFIRTGKHWRHVA